MKRMVFFSPVKPGAVLGGGLYKTSRLIEYFKEKYDFHGVYLFSNGLSVGNDEDIIIGRNDSRFEPCLKNLIKSYFFNVPMSVFRNSSKVSDVIAESVSLSCQMADVIFVDHFFMFQHVPVEYHGKVVFHEHNAEFKLWERRAILEKNFLKKLACVIEKHRVFKYEKQVINSSRLTFAAPVDIKFLTESNQLKKPLSQTFHLGDDLMLTREINKFSELGNVLVFLGGLSWEPNIQGVKWFLKSCWLKLRAAFPDLVLLIVGDVMPKIKDELEFYPGVSCMGYVDDLDSVLSKAKVFICPLQFGSGMKVKNITAMYKGLPIVSTSIGTESIDLVNGESVIIADDPQLFVRGVTRLLNDDALCKYLGSNARAVAKRRYCWDVMLDEMYLNICKLDNGS